MNLQELNVAIVDPVISPRYLATELRRHKVRVICITSFSDFSRLSSNNRIDPSLYDEVITIPSLDEEGFRSVATQLRARKISLVIYGYEHSVWIADQIKRFTFPNSDSDYQTSAARSDKFIMQEAIRRCDIPSVRQLRINNRELTVSQAAELKAWKAPLFVKPIDGVCSLSAKACATVDDVEAFLKQDQGRGMLNQNRFTDFVVQEQLDGDEYFVDTVSLDGRHQVASVQRYRKDMFKGSPIYRHIEILQSASSEYKLCSAYVLAVLQAVKLRDGFGHTEIFLTQNGPRLIEVNPRISGTAGFINKLTRTCTGLDQPTLLVDMMQGIMSSKESLRSEGYVMILQKWAPGTIGEFQTDLVRSLVSYVDHVVLKSPGTQVGLPETLLDSVAYVLISHADPVRLQHDYATLQSMEAAGVLF